MRQRTAALAAACLGVIAFARVSHGQVVINEFVYDDGSTDDREFVELFNSSASAVDISGWKLGGQDVVGPNTTLTVPASTSIPAGGFYVFGMTGVPNVNQTIPATFENDAETLELRNSSNVLQDAVLYESNKGAATPTTGYGTLPADVATNVGGGVASPGIFGNHQTNDLTTGLATSTLARYRDGRDTNNNGRDFGLRQATPGTSNTSPGVITRYTAPNVDALANDAVVPGYAYSFSPPHAITPGAVSVFNPNAISAPPTGNTKVLVDWDSTGGGNGAADARTMLSGGGFRITAYIDTADMPQNSNNVGTNFRGSEVSVFGLLGSVDALNNLTDLSGQIGVGSGIAANGSTGLAWVYEKVGVNGATGVSEKLFLVDAGDGGNSNSASTAPLEWTILATVDLSSTNSGWYDMSVDVDAAGVGTATFNGQTFNFTTTPNLDGSFYTGYRENAQVGTTLVPSFLRPPTWTVPVPEPTGLALFGVAGLGMLSRRRRA